MHVLFFYLFLFLCIKKKTGRLSAKTNIDCKLLNRILGEKNNQ